VPQLFIPKLIALHNAGLFPFDRLVKFYDFSKINTAIADAKSGDTVKPVLRISKAKKSKGVTPLAGKRKTEASGTGK
jgi:aryl-alcohol dehydrogenase